MILVIQVACAALVPAIHTEVSMMRTRMLNFVVNLVWVAKVVAVRWMKDVEAKAILVLWSMDVRTLDLKISISKTADMEAVMGLAVVMVQLVTVIVNTATWMDMEAMEDVMAVTLDTSKMDCLKEVIGVER
jgi:hypothetical protein